MGISSLGVGSSILTQDVLDQLREADEAGNIRPIEFQLANENDKDEALKIIDASMTNFIDSLNAVKNATLWNERSATVNTGTSVEVSAASNTDVQDFSLNVTQLATKQIEQSGNFSAITDTIASGAGTMSFNVDTTILGVTTAGLDADKIDIEYDATTTLDDLKDMINDEAKGVLEASIVQISSGIFRLFVSSAQTGEKDITMSDTGGLNADNKLDTAFTAPVGDAGVAQSGINSTLTFNNQAIERNSNKITDLIAGLTLTLKETGASDVSIAQDRTSILEKFDSFVTTYNANMTELDKMTNVSVSSEDRGIFAGDSTVKNMKRAISDMIDSIGGGVGSMVDYGFELDRDGVMTLDKTVLETAMDDNPVNTQAFFSGGDYTKSDLSVVTLTGSFSEMATIVESYTKTNQGLDQLKEALTQSISSLEDRKTTATERLDAKYEIMKKQWAAYDLMINKFNSASSMFVQIANAQTAAQNS